MHHLRILVESFSIIYFHEIHDSLFFCLFNCFHHRLIQWIVDLFLIQLNSQRGSNTRSNYIFSCVLWIEENSSTLIRNSTQRKQDTFQNVNTIPKSSSSYFKQQSPGLGSDVFTTMSVVHWTKSKIGQRKHFWIFT